MVNWALFIWYLATRYQEIRTKLFSNGISVDKMKTNKIMKK